MTRKIWENLRSVLVIIGLIWACYFISFVFDRDAFALLPRELPGLRGLIFMPLVHADLNQVLSNTLPLTSLLLMLRFSAPKFWRTLLALSLSSGMLLWLFGRSGVHLGANMLIYALAAWLITTGFAQRRLLAVAAAVLVTVSFGELFWKMFPTAGTHVLWESHLLGAVAGFALAWRKRTAQAADSSQRPQSQQVAAAPAQSAPLSIPASAVSSQPAEDTQTAEDGFAI